ncbi:hypothetical protein EV363DRAFT_1160616 [Boletus edulis]|uniref:Uncharacterized protein n=1 Tax=Boletus edulis BED1 TaxID=1328754 RepID=A0AAD4BFX2_BOLED|nr:hypothetical protein EV363DRAFT_1160616 [Boletus edulis]KAF8427126.1 hypothetical protein L210DRAFT_3652782 [Boletus edulis BED1]
MNTSHDIEKDVVVAAARVQAALEVVPRIIGPKEAWAMWMRDNLEHDVADLPKPRVGSPHPRLLGSLGAMLLRHYSGGMTVDTLRFDEVSADDPSVTGPEYVDLLVDALPELKGDMWWKVPPLSANFRISATSSKESSSGPAEDAAGRKKSSGEPAIRQVEKESNMESQHATGHKSVSRVPLDAKNTGTVPTTKRKKATQAAPPNKKKKVKVRSTRLVPSDEEDEMEIVAGPSTGLSRTAKGKAKAEAPGGPEAAKICDSCRSRGTKCVWPRKLETSASANEKRAWKFAIRPPRGKSARSGNEPQQDAAVDMSQLVSGLRDRLGDMEQKCAGDAEENERLVTRINNLELQVTQLKAKVSKQ